MPTHFTCFMCHKTFEKVRTDEDALVEAEAIFGPIPPDDRRFVCHDCWLKLPRIKETRRHAHN